jgi:hypothetical protein
LISIAAAHLYGVFFLKPPVEGSAAARVMAATPPFYLQPLVWTLAAVAVALAGLIAVLSNRRD